MAICRADYEIFKRIEADGLLPASPSLLELGEAEFYGDVPLHEFLTDIKARGLKDVFVVASGLVARARRNDLDGVCWALAKLVYETFLKCVDVTSIDLHGSEKALKIDLNDTRRHPFTYHMVYNTGTAEHVFHIGKVFEAIHEWTKPGGLMVHCFPFTGLMDHGFWHVNPTLVFDLAKANDYKILYLTVSNHHGHFRWLDPDTALKDLHQHAMADELPRNAWLHVAYRRPLGAAPFGVPRQAFYADEQDDPGLREDWKKLR